MSRLLLLASGLASGVAAHSGEPDLSEYSYTQHVETYGGEYGDMERRSVFEANLDVIRKHNADPSKDWFATVNEFTAWTNQEFRANRLGRRRSPEDEPAGSAPAAKHLSLPQISGLPDSVDWRTKAGVVTAPKNQGGCGSCWAFSTVETLESHLAIATGEPAPVLSEQQVVACAPNPDQCGGTGGCQGSTQPVGFNYTMEAGITLESDYPYSGGGSCQTDKIKPVAKNSGWLKLKVNDYNTLVTTLATKGPVAISLAAGSLGWQTYGGGIYSGKGLFGGCGYVQDHGVQLVGYGAENSKLYWIVRNSWGAGWGEKGYIRIERHGDGQEPCGTDKDPGQGEACKGDKSPRTYCGICGIMGSSSIPTGMKKLGQTLVV